MTAMASENAKAAMASEKAKAEDLRKAWQFFGRHRPPRPIAFPRRPELRNFYILGLTHLARRKGADNPGQRTHRSPQGGCICPWLTDDIELLDCAWCGMDKFNGQKQFCDHINGQHQKRCERILCLPLGLDNSSVTEAVEAVEQATQARLKGAAEGARPPPSNPPPPPAHPALGNNTWWDTRGSWQAPWHWEEQSHQCWDEEHWPAACERSSGSNDPWEAQKKPKFRRRRRRRWR